MKKRVVVTGIGSLKIRRLTGGLLTPLGKDTKSSWANLLQMKSGVVPLVDGFTRRNTKNPYIFDTSDRRRPNVPYAAFCKWDDDKMARNSPPNTSNFIRYALYAADEALRDASWQPTEDEQLEETGVAIGSGIGAIEEVIETALTCDRSDSYTRISPHFIPKILINLASGHVSIKYRFKGPNQAAATACAAGAHSIGDAFRLIQYGDANVMLAGGAESAINTVGLSAFAKAKALSTKYESSPETASRPFDIGRDGFVMGDGSAILVLEELEHAKSRGSKIYAEIVGYGMSGDGHHVVLPTADGKGAQLCMKRALKSAGIDSTAIGYINAHATSTKAGDLAEARAISQVFGSHRVLISSTKGATGHLLGAAGAMEAAFTVLALRNNVLPATLNLKQQGDDITIDIIKDQPLQKEIEYAMSNSFGFGGVNTCLIFKKYWS